MLFGREHPEMTEVVVVEVMTRQLNACATVHQHAMLSALAPWMENLSFAARWEGVCSPSPYLTGAFQGSSCGTSFA